MARAKKQIDYNPNARIAHKTMAAIEAAMNADNGKLFRYWLGKVLPHIGDAYRQDDEGHRSHLGASGLGHECFRKIYYDYRWFTRKVFGARMLRLFNRGHLEEGRIIALLLMIGVKVFQQDENGNQFRITFAQGHGGGSGDGKGYDIPDLAPGEWCLFEFKTFNDDRFNDLKRDGVKLAKPEHYVQMNSYMFKMGIPITLYVGVNKNTDELYMELITVNTYFAEEKLHIGEQIVYTDTPPTKINPSPGFFKCKFCDHYGVCHTKQAPDFNCRTCVHSKPLRDGTWRCNLHDKPLSKEDQFAGCRNGYEAIT